MQTNLNKFLFYFTAVIVGFATLTLIPNFTYQLGDDALIEWDGLSSLGVSNRFFNLTKGRGVYETTRIEMKANAEDLTDEEYLTAYTLDKDVVNQRLALVNNTINTQAASIEYVNSDDKGFAFDFPSYILEPEQLATDLVSGNSVRIITSGPASGQTEVPEGSELPTNSLLDVYFPDYDQLNTPLSTNDVFDFSVGASSLINGNVLRTKFNTDSNTQQLIRDAFESATYDPNTGNPIYPVLLMNGDIPEFWAFHPDIFGQLSSGSTTGEFPTEIVWVPLATNDDRINLSLKAATIFAGQVGLPYEVESNRVLAANYAPEGITVLAGSVAVLVVLIIIATLAKFKLRKGMYVSSGILATLVTAASLTKLLNIQIDPIMIMTFVAMTVVTAIVIWKVFSADKDQLSNHLSSYFSSGSILFLMTAILFQIPVFSLARGYEVLLVFSITWLASAAIYLRGITSMINN